jgi:hypothetical protein
VDSEGHPKRRRAVAPHGRDDTCLDPGSLRKFDAATGAHARSPDRRSLFRGRGRPAQLVGYVQNDHQSIQFRKGLSVAEDCEGEPVPVRVHVETPGRPGPCQASRRISRLGPRARLLCVECIPVNSVGCDHDSLIERAVEQFPSRLGPGREHAAAGRDLPLATGARKSPHVHFELSRLARLGRGGWRDRRRFDGSSTGWAS